MVAACRGAGPRAHMQWLLPRSQQTGLLAAACNASRCCPVLPPGLLSRGLPCPASVPRCPPFPPTPSHPQIHASPIFSNSLSVGSCGSPLSPAFWVSQLLASGVPWLIVHAVLFPLTINQGIVVHGVSS